MRSQVSRLLHYLCVGKRRFEHLLSPDSKSQRSIQSFEIM